MQNVCSSQIWPRTLRNQTAVLNCGGFDSSRSPTDQIVTRRCSAEGSWLEEDISRCDLKSLLNACSDTEKEKRIAGVFKEILKHTFKNDLFEEKTSTAQVLGLAQTVDIIGTSNVEEEYVLKFESVVQTVPLQENQSLEYSGSSIGVFSADLNSASISNISSFRVNISTSEKQSLEKHTILEVDIARSVLESTDFEHKDNVRVSIITYDNHSLYSTEMVEAKQQSRIASVHVSGKKNVFIGNKISLEFHGMPADSGDAMCVYWLIYRHTWSPRGVETRRKGDEVICTSTHLTSFSVLFDPVGVELSIADETALTILSFLLGSISTICLILTIFVYTLFPSLRDHSGKILLQLCLSLALLNMVVLVPSISPNYQMSQRCVALAIVIHYLTLVALSWMLVEGLNILQLLIKVFASNERWFLRKRMALCWGVPMLIVGVAAGLDFHQYTSAVNVENCVITAHRPLVYYLSFFAPGCGILLINCVVFVIIIGVVAKQRKSKFPQRKTAAPTQIVGVLTIMTLLGIGWILGVLQVGPVRILFAYLFVLVNASQGISIFVLRCLLYSPAARSIRALTEFVRFQRDQSSEIHSSSICTRKHCSRYDSDEDSQSDTLLRQISSEIKMNDSKDNSENLSTNSSLESTRKVVLTTFTVQ